MNESVRNDGVFDKTRMGWILSGILATAGIVHLAKPEVFLPAMPGYIPWHLEVIYLTGVLEILAAVGLQVEPARRLTAWLLAAYFVAILPAHWHVAVNGIAMFGVSNPVFLWMRLAFQSVFIYWAISLAKR